MDPSDDISSLLELVNSQLSQTSLGPSTSRDIVTAVFESSGVPIPETQFPLVQYNTHQPFKTDPVVAQQIANTLKAKEAARLKKEEEDKKKRDAVLANIAPVGPEEYQIDLTSAIINPVTPPQMNESAGASNQVCTSAQVSEETVDEIINRMENLLRPKEVEPPMPFQLENSDLLIQKMKRKRISYFGGILCARYVYRYCPYTRNKIPIYIKPYQFKDPSPDDLMIERMKNEPKGFDVMAYYGLEISESLQKSQENAKKREEAKKLEEAKKMQKNKNY